jgi:hypothetical protein
VLDPQPSGGGAALGVVDLLVLALLGLCAIVYRAISGHLIRKAGLKRASAVTGAYVAQCTDNAPPACHPAGSLPSNRNQINERHDCTDELRSC